MEPVTVSSLTSNRAIVRSSIETDLRFALHFHPPDDQAADGQRS
jgi:hypothetical protein